MGYGVVKSKRVYCGPGARYMKGVGCVTEYRSQPASIGTTAKGPDSFRATNNALLGLGPLKPVKTAVQRPAYVVKPALLKAKAAAKAWMKRPSYRISKR